MGVPEKVKLRRATRTSHRLRCIVPFQYAFSPTIRERVAFGLEINTCDGGAIVPFPDGWAHDHLAETLVPAARAMLARLRSEGFEMKRLDIYTDEEGQLLAHPGVTPCKTDDGRSVPLHLSRQDCQHIGLRQRYGHC